MGEKEKAWWLPNFFGHFTVKWDGIKFSKGFPSAVVSVKRKNSSKTQMLKYSQGSICLDRRKVTQVTER